MSFDGRHIVVTGASTGIGRATVDVLIERGARVTMVARSRDTLDGAVAILGANATFAVADVADKVALITAFDTAEAAFGPIDGLFANAGMGGRFAPFTDYADETFDQVMRVNLTSVFWAMKRVLPGMVTRKRGSIVATGSLASARGMANNPGYVASKHALVGLVRAAALEAAPHGVRVNAILPGLIETPLLDSIDTEARQTMAHHVPQARLGSAREVGEVAAFLLSDAASHVTGQNMAVDGGMLGTLRLGE